MRQKKTKKLKRKLTCCQIHISYVVWIYNLTLFVFDRMTQYKTIYFLILSVLLLEKKNKYKIPRLFVAYFAGYFGNQRNYMLQGNGVDKENCVILSGRILQQ